MAANFFSVKPISRAPYAAKNDLAANWPGVPGSAGQQEKKRNVTKLQSSK
jgi:hypothetical protein